MNDINKIHLVRIASAACAVDSNCEPVQRSARYLASLVVRDPAVSRLRLGSVKELFSFPPRVPEGVEL